MYSVVIAAVLSTGTPAPAFGGLFSNQNSGMSGCYGCMGYGCAGNSCMGCYGQSCQGCAGCQGSGFLGIRDFFGNLFSLGGCQGCNGCMGGCQGCYGGCMGGMGCYGGHVISSYDVTLGGGMPMGGMPMGGMPMGGGMPYGQMPYGQMPSQPDMQYPMPINPSAIPNQPPQLPTGPPPTVDGVMTPPDRTKVVVTLPADARLYVNAQLMQLTGNVRVFQTPVLPMSAKPLVYTIRMEVERGGKVQEKTEKVELQPGKTANVFFPDPSNNGGGTARIDVNVPNGATLTVEGETWPAGQRSITTPTLNPGQNYVYTLKLDRELNGRKETLTRDVSFRAGEVVAVDFQNQRALASR